MLGSQKFVTCAARVSGRDIIKACTAYPEHGLAPHKSALDGLPVPQVSLYNLGTAGGKKLGGVRGSIAGHSAGSESFVGQEGINHGRACV